jgi:hypothetical protein
VEEMLRSFVNYRQDDWDTYLLLIEFAYNNTIHASTRITPFFANYGQHPNTPVTFLQGNSNQRSENNDIIDESNVAVVEEFIEQTNSTLKIIQDCLVMIQEKQAKQVNKHRTDEVFQKGDKVLLNVSLATPAYDQLRQSKKLNSKYIGPFVIEEMINSNAYKLCLPPTV